ncbi:MAG: hypothetical protein ACOYOK_07995 [Pseudobdellovibrionaceae bacterium]
MKKILLFVSGFLVLSSCDRPLKTQRATFFIDFKNLYAEGVRSQSFPANQKVCFAAEINGPNQPLTAAGSCFPALGLFKGFVESNQSIQLEAERGSNYTLRIFAEIKNIGDNSNCSDWLPNQMDYSKIYKVAEQTNLNLDQDAQTVQITTNFPGAANHLKSTLGLSTCSAVATCTGTDLVGADLTATAGQTLSGTYCNVGTFTVPAGITAYAAAQQKLIINASTENILGTLNADEKGYAAMTGPGAPSSTLGGAGHLGQGGGATGGSGAVSPTAPTEMGSGGGDKAGGGYIEINATTTMVLSGSIYANGGSSSTLGSGSGGTVRIKSPTVTGSGSIFANGGSSVGSLAGGGAGGAVVIHADSIPTLVYATSGAGNNYDTAYSIYHGAPAAYVQKNYSTGTITKAQINGHNYPARTLDINAFSQAASIYIGSQAYVEITSTYSGPALYVDGGELKLKTNANVGAIQLLSGNLYAQDNATISSLTATGGNIYSSANTVTWGDITISGASTKFKADPVRYPVTATPVIIKATNLSILSSASIDVVGSGFSATYGPGGTSTGYQGGTYGGAGGGNGSTTYGSNTNPDDFGSGGYGSAGDHSSYWGQGSGGGKVRIQVSNLFTLDGTINANGVSGFCCISIGAGAGGSVFIKANQFAGTGSIAANGGSHPGTASGSGGGGGRVAIYYNSKTHSGSVTANGGTGYGAPNGASGSFYDGGNSSYSGAPAL